MNRLKQLLVTPAEALFEDQHPYQHAQRRVRATRRVIEQLGKALLGNALGDLIEEHVVPGCRIVELRLVTLAQELLDVAEQIDLAAVWTRSEHTRGCSVGGLGGYEPFYQPEHSDPIARSTFRRGLNL